MPSIIVGMVPSLLLLFDFFDFICPRIYFSIAWHLFIKENDAMKKYLWAALATVALSVAAVHADTVQSWKSGGTTATYSDGTLKIKPGWGIAVEYVVSGYCLKNIPKIRWSGAMKDYTIIAPPWRSVADSITNVVIEPGVTYIGVGAFDNEFRVLKSVTIPNTVTEIGMRAFDDCVNLDSVTIPESVTKIGIEAFPGQHSNLFYSGKFYSIGMYSITSLNPVPPAMEFQRVCVKTILYVPDGSVDAYRAADGWNGFKNIKPINGEIGDEPSLEERDCFCRGICQRNEENYWKEYLQGESVWIKHITLILMLYGIAYWLYLLLVFMLKKKYRAESKKPKVLSIILAPILAFVILCLWDFGWYYWWGRENTLYEVTHLPYYDSFGAFVYCGIYLAVASIFYQVFRKKIKRRATLVIPATLHIIIFASLIIGGGL